MRKFLLLFILPLVLMGQGFKISEAEGQWYGSTYLKMCDNIFCSVDSLTIQHYASKLNIKNKGSVIEIVSNAKAQAQDFYETQPIIQDYIYYDTSYGPVKEGRSYFTEASSSIIGGELLLYRLDATKMYFTRNAKNYLNMLLSSHHWPAAHIFSIVNDSSFIYLLEPSGNSFETTGDTLMLRPGNSKFLYDSAAQVYRNVRNSGMVMYLIDSYTLKFETTYKGQTITSIMGGRPWPKLIRGWAAHKGTWQSMTRPGVYFKVYDAQENLNDTLTAYIQTNGIDGLHQIKYSTRADGKPLAHLGEMDTLVCRAVKDGNQIYFNVSEASMLPSAEPTFPPYPPLPSFLHERRLYTFGYSGALLVNMATGEQFSKVVGIDEEVLHAKVILKSNPIAEEVEVLNLDEFDYRIYNINGQMMASGHSSTGKIQMQDQNQGLYMLRVISQNSELVLRFIKE